MIQFYKRKIEWEISLGSATKIHDEIHSGSFECYNIQGMNIKPISTVELSAAILCFEKCCSSYSEVFEFAKSIANDIWSFTVVCDFEYKKCNTKVQHALHYGISICFMGNAVDFICVNSVEDFETKFKVIEEYRRFEKLPRCVYSSNLATFPLIFHNSAAATLAHEVFGHIFEVDNFHRYNYSNILNLLQTLRINICDDPLIVGSPGFYTVDDMGIKAKQTIVLRNGILNGLIGCQDSGYMVNNALRRENYDQPCYPRMSNLLVTSTSSKKHPKPSQYVQIDKLSKCFIYHNEKTVELNVDFSFLHDKNADIPLKPFKLKFGVSDLLEKLTIIDGGDMTLRPIQCAKHNQVINCGISTPDWMISYG